LIDSVDLIMNKIKFWREKESQRKIKQLWKTKTLDYLFSAHLRKEETEMYPSEGTFKTLSQSCGKVVFFTRVMCDVPCPKEIHAMWGSMSNCKCLEQNQCQKDLQSLRKSPKNGFEYHSIQDRHR
jgi:hypothetical protein